MKRELDLIELGERVVVSMGMENLPTGINTVTDRIRRAQK